MDVIDFAFGWWLRDAGLVEVEGVDVGSTYSGPHAILFCRKMSDHEAL